MNTQTDRSYGIIPIRKNGRGYEAFLINQYSRIGDNTYWVFPKGHAEGEETAQVAAERELKEETGLVADRIIDSSPFELSYRFTIEGRVIEKTVIFFVGLIESSQVPTLDPEEVREAGWFALEDVRERLDYDNTRELFDRVREALENENLL